MQKFSHESSRSSRLVALLLAPIVFVIGYVESAIAQSCGDPNVEWSFQWENDSFPGASRSGSDRFYTNGLRLTRMKNGEGLGFLQGVLHKAWFSSESDRNDGYCSRSGFRFGHQFYTPQTITRTELDVDDRPYAGFVYFSSVLGEASRPADDSPDAPALVLRTADLQVGLVGPGAGARGIQTEWHALSFIDAPKPLGWHNQLPNEPAVNLNLTAARRYPIGQWMDVVPQVDVGIGTVFTGAQLGSTIRIGNELSQFPYQRIQPALLGYSTSAESRAGRPRFVWWVFAGIEGKAVLHDIFLDGTLFSSSHSVDKEMFRSVATAGVHLQYDNFGADLMWVTHSKEFETQRAGVDRHEYLSLNFQWGIGGR